MNRICCLLIWVIVLVFSNCSSDELTNDVVNEEKPIVVKMIGKYVESTMFNSSPKYSIEDYGAYYFTTTRKDKIWLVDYNLHERKKIVYSEIKSIENGIYKMSGYWEGTDYYGNPSQGSGPAYIVDFSKQGVITSNEFAVGWVFYY